MFKVWYKRSTGQLGTGRFGENLTSVLKFKIDKILNSKCYLSLKIHIFISCQVPQEGCPMFRLLLIVAQQEQPTPPSRP